jgi:hypothetical protein
MVGLCVGVSDTASPSPGLHRTGGVRAHVIPNN